MIRWDSSVCSAQNNMEILHFHFTLLIQPSRSSTDCTVDCSAVCTALLVDDFASGVSLSAYKGRWLCTLASSAYSFIFSCLKSSFPDVPH